MTCQRFKINPYNYLLQKYFDISEASTIYKEEDLEWKKTKDIIIEWIVDHPEPSIDELLACWLDSSESLHKTYKVLLFIIFLL